MYWYQDVLRTGLIFTYFFTAFRMVLKTWFVLVSFLEWVPTLSFLSPL